jgi:hypothetical protein
MGRVLISAFLTDVMACSSVETAPSAYSCLLIRERHIPVYESDSAKATFIRPPHEMLLDRRLFSACSPSSSDVSKPHSAVQVLLEGNPRGETSAATDGPVDINISAVGDLDRGWRSL